MSEFEEKVGVDSWGIVWMSNVPHVNVDTSTWNLITWGRKCTYEWERVRVRICIFWGSFSLKGSSVIMKRWDYLSSSHFINDILAVFQMYRWACLSVFVLLSVFVSAVNSYQRLDMRRCLAGEPCVLTFDLAPADKGKERKLPVGTGTDLCVYI